jgi:HK97 family phage portal protein
VVALRGLEKVQQISMSAQEMQLLEQIGFGVAEVGRFLGIPLSLLMDYSNSSYKTPEAATQELMQRTIQPQIGEIEDELNAKLLSPADWGSRRFHVCELPLLRLDMKSQADIDLKRLQTGWSPNEIRGQYDMPAVDGGDDHYVSTNLAKAGSPKLTGETTEPVSAPTEPVLEPNGGEGAEGGEE